MGYASLSGRAQTSSRNPIAFGVCDRCGFLYNLPKLRWQFEYSGAQLVNLQLRVCNECMDDPQPQLKARRIGPDPVPVRDPRPDNATAEMNSTALMVAYGGSIIDIE